MKIYSNPFLNREGRQQTDDIYSQSTKVKSTGASYKGMILKSVLLIGLAILSGLASVLLLLTSADSEVLSTVFIVGLVISSIGSLLAGIIGFISRKLAAPMAIVYTISQGFLIGLSTLFAEMALPGVGIIAGSSVAIIFISMFVLYFTNMIKVNKTFMKTLTAIMISIMLISIVFLLVFLINPSYQVNLGISIGVSILFIVYGALMLTLDFSNAENVVKYGGNKQNEWQVSLGLMVSLIWIYVRLLQLIMMLARSRNRRN